MKESKHASQQAQPGGAAPDTVLQKNKGVDKRRVAMDAEYIVFVLLALNLIAIGMVLAPSLAEAFQGYRFLLTHPAMLDFDALHWAGNYGTAFINAGVMLLIVLGIYRLTKTELQGTEVASMMLVMGFAFYGKNPVNIWFPFLGVLLHAWRSRIPLSKVMALAWFATALSPVFSVTSFGTAVLGPGSPLAIFMGVLFGVMAGYITGALALYLPQLHKGRVLYNAGFAAGIAGVMINAIKSGFGLGHQRYEYYEGHYVVGDNLRLSIYLAILFAYLIAAGYVLDGKHKYKKILWYRCFGGNFIEEFGIGATLINMGIVGFVSVLYVHLTGVGHLNGPVIACIWTAVGFAAAGVTLREFLPTMAGVYLMAFLTGGVGAAIGGGAFLAGAIEKVGSRSMILAAIFSCGLAPVVGEFGLLAGLFVGAMHSLLVPLTASLHGWMSLYNNAFSMGIIVVFLYPLYAKLKVGKREREIHVGPHVGPEG